MGGSFVASLDMYRKVPLDLIEGTRRGSVLSTLAVFTMGLLFFLETKAFRRATLHTSLALDSNKDTKIRVNFNITMMDLKCDYATIDVVSVLGTQQNVSQHLTKAPIDQFGVRREYRSRNDEQRDVQLYDTTIELSIEELHEDGEHAISLDQTTLEVALEENTYVFVDFFANWCSHCRDLAPTWETLAEVMLEVAEDRVDEGLHYQNHIHSEEEFQAAVRVELPVLIGKVDCVHHGELCSGYEIRAYPTLKFFVDGEEKADFSGHRTVVELAHFIEEMEKRHKGATTTVKTSGAKHFAEERTIQNDAHEAYARALSATRRTIKQTWADEVHPGCNIYGFLLVDRAPGNFHIQAQSRHHDLAAHLTNVSHIVHHLSYGKRHFKLKDPSYAPPGFLRTTRPFDGNVYVTHQEHEAHHHYMKVVTTINLNQANGRAYQILQSSQLSLYKSDIVPEAKFTYDLSPIAVTYENKYRPWYDYLTSVMAIVGGIFTVVGMLESGIYSVSRKKNR